MIELLRKGLAAPAFWALVLQTIVANLLPYAVQSWLLRHMDAERRSRVWNGLSWGVAVLTLNALSMIPFAWVTRPRRGFEAGVVALAAGCDLMIGTIAVGSLVNALVGWLLLGDAGFPG